MPHASMLQSLVLATHSRCASRSVRSTGLQPRLLLEAMICWKAWSSTIIWPPYNVFTSAFTKLRSSPW